MEEKIKVAILDDHPIFVQGYFTRLQNCPTVEVVGDSYCGEGMEKMLETNSVDVLLMDVEVPVSDTCKNSYPILLAIPTLIQRYPGLQVLVVSMHNQGTLIRAVMEAGASGYVLKDDRYFLSALPEIIDLIAHGGMYMSGEAKRNYFTNRSGQTNQLTQRQLQVLSLCASFPEANTSVLAEKLNIAGSTLRNLLSSAYLHLDVHSRVAAVAKAQQLGLIGPTVKAVDLQVLSGKSPDEE